MVPVQDPDPDSGYVAGENVLTARNDFAGLDTFCDDAAHFFHGHSPFVALSGTAFFFANASC